MELYGHHMCPDFPKLPTNSCERDDSIIIIGAGIAGLSAAMSLKLMGCMHVAVLEASDGVGGRLKSTSIIEEHGGPPLDVGAEWIHSVKGDQVLRSIMNFNQDGTEDPPKDYDVVVPELIGYKPTVYVNKWRSGLLTWMYKETKFKSTTWHRWLLSNFEPVLDCVELNSPVADIDYTSQNVVLTLADGSKRTADRVICTAPLQVIKEDIIKFNPPVPTSMKDAIDQIEMPPGFRILFRMSKQFYRDVTYVGSLCGDPDEITAIYDPLWGKELTKKDLHCIAYVAIGHKNAGEMSELSDDELAKEALARIDKLYDGQGSKYLVGLPTVQNWRAEPFIRGAYTFSGGDRSRIRKPIGDDGKGSSLVYFAGEHTSSKYRSLVPGAACEGRRAALEVASSLGVDIGA